MLTLENGGMRIAPKMRLPLAKHVGDRFGGLGDGGHIVLAQQCGQGGSDLALRDRRRVGAFAERGVSGPRNPIQMNSAPFTFSPWSLQSDCPSPRP